jgi:uncharacterized protein YjiS (DUF1127 family)
MNVHVNTSRYFEPTVELRPKRLQFSQAIGKYLRSAARFVEALRAAQIVTRQAERYYAMSDSQLASIGLARENVPAELRHALERNQLD